MPTSRSAPSPNQEKIDRLEARKLILTQKRDRLTVALADCERELERLRPNNPSELNA